LLDRLQKKPTGSEARCRKNEGEVGGSGIVEGCGCSDGSLLPSSDTFAGSTERTAAARVPPLEAGLAAKGPRNARADRPAAQRVEAF
jgi:hypothetical protein